MSLIGIDFGNDSCYVAIAKAGGIETLVNDYSLRGTPSCVAFSQKNRILGVAAKNQIVTNMKNTVFGFKRLLGRTFSDPLIQEELKHLPFTVESRKEPERWQKNVGIRVNYLGEENVYCTEQITAMLFTKLKESVETPVTSCVISVPSYFTNSERKAILDAADIAGLNVLRLFNDTTATALAYGIYKDDLPAPEEKPRNVIFVDFGHSSLQVAACAFNKGKLRMLATSTDARCGGRDIDMALADHFCKEFMTRMKLDARQNPRAFLRLLQEAEKLKKQMSASSTRLPLNVECFMEDRDVSSEMERSQMEQICASIFQRVETTLRAIMRNANLSTADIHSVEIVGGSTRIPAVKALIEQVFGKPVSTTLNQDEAVSRGCAIQCALLSPGASVRQFSVVDLQPYPVRLTWDTPDGGEELFPAFHVAPYSKTVTFEREEAFAVSAHYSERDTISNPGYPYPNKTIGEWFILEVDPSPDGRPEKVKLKVGVDINGIISVENENQEDNANDKIDKSECRKQRLIYNGEIWLWQQEVKRYIEAEEKMKAADLREKERADARNDLEEYVYKEREKLADAGSGATSLARALDVTEKWLYEDGEHQERQVYMDILDRLQWGPGGIETFLSKLPKKVKREKSAERQASHGFHEAKRKNLNVNEPSTAQSEFNGNGSFGTFNQAQPSSSNGNINTNEKDIRYFSELKELNKSALDWMIKHFEQNPYCILSSVFTDYDKYLKEISNRRISN